jgi:hypothetical protein
MGKYYTFPDAEIAFEKIIEYFNFLTNDYGYEITSKEVKKYYVKIIYENLLEHIVIKIGNETDYTDYGFSVFIYELEKYREGKSPVNILNKPYEEQDEECVFIKKASEFLFKNYLKLTTESDKKIIKIK